jgi:hypothetical protein
MDFNIGMGGVNKPLMSAATIQDGTSNTIMLAEMRVGLSPRDRRGVWAMGMCGSNFHCRHASNGISGPNDCAGDDDTFGAPFIREDVDAGTLNLNCMNTFTDESGQSTVRSLHAGGAFVAMVDGSAKFVSDFIEGGKVQGGAFIGENVNDTLESNFGLWQRLNAASDSMVVGQPPS